MHTTAEHTPGPWEAIGAEVYAPAPATVRPLIARCIYGPPDERANAHLIAAAPDLLEALRYIVAWNPDGWDGDRARAQALAAIAKAEGRDEP